MACLLGGPMGCPVNVSAVGLMAAIKGVYTGGLMGGLGLMGGPMSRFTLCVFMDGLVGCLMVDLLGGAMGGRMGGLVGGLTSGLALVLWMVLWLF